MVYSNEADRLPHRPNIGVNKLVIFCQSLDLIDIWRVKNPGEKQYTWSNRDRSLQSRIDLWMITSSLEPNTVEVKILPAVLTDHKAIRLTVRICSNDDKKYSGGYWKLNNSLLLHDDLKDVIKNLISVYWNLATSNAEFGKYWELLKCKIRSACITYGKRLALRRRCEVAEL